MPALKRGRTMARSRSRARSMSNSRSVSRTNYSGAFRGQVNGTASRGASLWYQNASALHRAFNPFPAKMTATLRYNDTVAYTTTTGVPTPYQWRCNSIYDPDYTGTGHQPYGHDQYAAIYNHYMVKKAVISVCPSTGFNGRLIIVLSDDTTISTDENTAAEQKGTVSCIQSGNISPTVLRSTYYPRANFALGDYSTLSAAVGTNPTEAMYWSILQYANTPTGSISGFMKVTIEYVVEFWEMKDLGAS